MKLGEKKIKLKSNKNWRFILEKKKESSEKKNSKATKIRKQ